MSKTNPATENFRKHVMGSKILTEAEKTNLMILGREMSMEAYKAGVKKGYVKILEDHRAGFINIPDAPAAKLNEAIKLAQDDKLMPSEFFL